MALFINGVGQDSFSMNGVSVDNLYVDGVLVWSSAVNTAPVITIVGDNPTYLVLNGDAYVEQGATATDTEDGDITNDIVIGGDTPDVSVEGYYYVTYNVTDSEGLAANEAVRTVEVYVVTVPKYELTEALTTDGIFNYVPDSNNPESIYNGRLQEPDTTPYLPTSEQYPQNGLLALPDSNYMATNYIRLDSDAQYGIYEADGSTVYKIWAIENTTGTNYNVYEGDQDIPLTITFADTELTIPNESIKILDERPSWLPVVVDNPELVPNPNFDTNIDGVVADGTTRISWEAPGYWRTQRWAGSRYAYYDISGLEIGVQYIADITVADMQDAFSDVSIRTTSLANYGDMAASGAYIGPVSFNATATVARFYVDAGTTDAWNVDLDAITLKKDLS